MGNLLLLLLLLLIIIIIINISALRTLFSFLVEHVAEVHVPHRGACHELGDDEVVCHCRGKKLAASWRMYLKDPERS
jgi:hypothetical protein